VKKIIILFSALMIILLVAGCSSSTKPSSQTQINQPGAKDYTPQTASSTADAGSVQIKGFAFNPDTLTVKPGTAVVWTNEDSATHIIVAESGEFTSDQLAKGDSFTFKFDNKGTYNYYCSIHPSMKGTIVVE
jgi:plastocyanin